MRQKNLQAPGRRFVVTDVEFDELVEAHGEDILRYCRITAGNSLGDELYQETLLRLWEQHRRLEPDGNLKSYALSIAVRVWKNEKRKYARRRRLAPSLSYEEGVENGDFAEQSAGDAGGPEQKMVEQETTREIRQAVWRLSEKYRQVVILHYSADLKTKDIAKCLRISEGIVKTRLRKARELLKKELEDKLYG